LLCIHYNSAQHEAHPFFITRITMAHQNRSICKVRLTLNLLTTTIDAPPSNASKWQMGFNSAFKGLRVIAAGGWYSAISQWQVHGNRNTRLRNWVMVNTQASSGYCAGTQTAKKPFHLYKEAYGYY